MPTRVKGDDKNFNRHKRDMARTVDCKNLAVELGAGANCWHEYVPSLGTTQCGITPTDKWGFGCWGAPSPMETFCQSCFRKYDQISWIPNPEGVPPGAANAAFPTSWTRCSQSFGVSGRPRKDEERSATTTAHPADLFI